MRLTRLAAVIGCALIAGGCQAQHDHSNHVELTPDQMPGDSLYQLDSEWYNSKGQKTRLADFAGKSVVVAMIYTSCEYACPLIVGKMLSIYEELDEQTRDNTYFVLFSFDPERDTVDKLQPYKVASSIDLPEWRVLTSGDDEALELAIALGIRYKPAAGGDFSHSNTITMLDKSGVPAVQIPSLDTPIDEALAALKHSAGGH